MNGLHFTGTMRLLKFYLRRDRFLLPTWILLSMWVIATQLSFVNSLPDWQEFITELSSMQLTAALLGPIKPLSLEGAILWRGMLQSSIVVMFGAAFTTIRHTLTEEVSGRNELILGKPVGRFANLTAALILSCTGSLLAGLLASFILIISGFAIMGSLIAGATLTLSGWIFAGIGALSAQIFEHSGQARGVIFGFYGLTMVSMVLNNINGGYTGFAWLVPEAWFRITIPFGENRIWPLFLFIILCALPVLIAYRLLARRDLGAGIIKEKLGSATASPRLNSPLSLAYKQHKFMIFIWIIAMTFLGVALGSVIPSISDTVSSMLVDVSTWDEAIAKLGNQEGFMALCIYILGLMAGLSVFGISMVQNIRHEENEHYSEMILSKPISRYHWMGSYLVIAFLGSAIILLSLGLSSGIGWSITSGDINHLPRVLVMSLSKIPSVWTIIGIATLLYGWLPKIAPFLSWVILGIFIFIEMLWEVGIVGWSALQLTPFAYAHYTIPIQELSIISLIILTGIAAALTYLGLLGFKHRSVGL